MCADYVLPDVARHGLILLGLVLEEHEKNNNETIPKHNRNTVAPPFSDTLRAEWSRQAL